MKQAESEFLSKVELRDLTDCARAGQQAEWLKAKGIPFHQDGRRIIASRFHVRQWLEGVTVVRSSGLNLAGIR